MNRAFFLDRDGVMNQAFVKEGKSYFPSLEDLPILPEVPEALHSLKAAGFYLIVVTSQPDVERKTQEKNVSGCFTIFVENHYAEALKESPDRVYRSLLEAAKMVLRRERKNEEDSCSLI